MDYLYASGYNDWMDDLTAIKELLDTHLRNINERLKELAEHYYKIQTDVIQIKGNTEVAIANLYKDIVALEKSIAINRDEIKGIKTRMEIAEEVRAERWTDEEKRWVAQDIRTKEENKKDASLENWIRGLGLILATLILSSLWNYFIK